MSNDEKIYQKMLKAIVEHQLPPGSRLPEDKLSEAFGVSRTGIRKVLQRLAIERFVVIQPNKGAQVNHPSRQEAEEVLDSRIMLEPMLIPEIADNWNLKAAQQFRAMVQQEKQAEQDEQLAKSIQLTADFHIKLAQMGNNQVLASFIEQLCFRSSLVIAAYGTKDSVSCNCGDHAELIDLLDQRKVSEAQDWMRHHLSHIKSSISLNGKQDSPVNFNSLFADAD
ncbi:GntR family transcriptional regulator [Agarivorans gilvus]|uniref:GntR family transcriptional regulator n=1 Tax=Agarivorans gilvus TaxID=680279 RepID=A0ABQ1I1B0_9ALTE|nr:GntR family transcriptional regulator [Agarivorans gilvus]GGB01897.1 GntR family transcriptional regulator [Agarivorans gilvus]